MMVNKKSVLCCKDCRFIIPREDGTYGCYRHFIDELKLDDFCSYAESLEEYRNKIEKENNEIKLEKEKQKYINTEEFKKLIYQWCLATPESKNVCINDIFSVLKEMNGIYV
jgi:hypothetical protein